MSFDNNTLRAVGTALYGSNWLHQLAQAIRVDSRTMRRWEDGTMPIPGGVWKDIAQLCVERAAPFNAWARRLAPDIKTAGEWVVDAFNPVTLEFDRELGRSDQHQFALALYDWAVKMLPHMLVILRQGEIISASSRPNVALSLSR